MDTKGAVIDDGAAAEQLVLTGDRVAMATPQPALRDKRDVLRDAVEDVEREIALVDAPPTLRAAWVSLVDMLALGPAPELRNCPSCGNVCRRAATRCGYCWTALVSETAPPVSAP